MNLIASNNNREQLVSQKQQLIEQLVNLNQIIGEDGEQILLEAISQQRWYGFKNKREIVFDSHTGMLFPNFNFMPHVKYRNWQLEQKKYAPNGIGQKQWDHLGNYFSQYNCFKFPNSFKGKIIPEHFFYQEEPNSSYHSEILYDFKNELELGSIYNIKELYVFPCLKILDKPELLPEFPRLTAHEKAEIILEFFIEQDWIPNFEFFLDKFHDEDKEDFKDRLAEAKEECNEYNHVFDTYCQRIQVKKQLIILEQQVSELPESENKFNADFDYRQELQNYNLTEINTSVWQYALSAQQWFNHLLTQIDSWANNHQHLLANALELNNTLAKKLPSSTNSNEIEQQFLDARHQTLQQYLNFSLEPLRATLLDLLQQSQKIELNLQNTCSLTALAELETQVRPSFTLLVEHSAILCTQTLKKLEWLEKSLDFVNHIVQSAQQSTENYLILLDKYQSDLKRIGVDNSIEAEYIEQWFSEWRQERLQMLQQWQPLVEAGLNGVISNQTVLDTLECLEQYQQQLDQFYLQKRLGIHTTYAFQSNGHRQEKLEKELKLTELNHQFMQNLEKVIFATENSTQKIWLIRFSEVWQEGIVKEITKFLENEKLLERNDITQIMSEEMRQIQQKSLTSCLQDAKNYSQALLQREQDTNTLIFKMRKALQA
ncbi:hypothetical protein N5D44_05835 [Acinetobacter junii]|uniref:hypothetical protein n=1 Tax=Acinetobacter junii TaxID=40215 RepID=UPI00244A9BD5|nr:hypothetical protein [Acinetobacter junii]MDH1857863.1 hypothetical protein [Acinetobacter junii]